MNSSGNKWWGLEKCFPHLPKLIQLNIAYLLSYQLGPSTDRSRLDGSLDRQFRKKPCLFNDTTRLRISCRPALTGSTFNAAAASEKLGRHRIISQSFKDKLTTVPSRPKDPPPPPPQPRNYGGIEGGDDGPVVRILHTSSVVSTCGTSKPNPTKPPRQKKTSRSNSFSPHSQLNSSSNVGNGGSNSSALATFFNRSFSHITKSLSVSSLDEVGVAEPIYEEIPSESVTVAPSRGSSCSSVGRPLPPVPKQVRFWIWTLSKNVSSELTQFSFLRRFFLVPTLIRYFKWQNC